MIDVIKAIIVLPFALVWRIVSIIGSLPLQVPAINHFFERLTTRIFRTDTPVAALDRMAKHSLAVSRGEAGNWFERFDRDSIDSKQALLIEDKLLAYAHRVLPPERFGSCYRNDIPADLVRPIISDGRALNGQPPSVAFGARCLTDAFIGDAWHKAARAAAGAGLLTLSLIVGVACAYIWIQFDDAYKAAGLGQGDVAAYVPKLDAMTVASQYRDVWSQADVDEINKGMAAIEKSQRTAQVVGVMASSIVQSILVLAIAIASGLALAWITAQIWFVGTFRGLVTTAVANSVEPLRYTGREALQRYSHRLPEREEARAGYERQIVEATTIDKSPFLKLGISLGILNYRGHLHSVPIDTDIGLSVWDSTSHMAILGLTGTGKTILIKNLVSQFVELVKQGYPIGLFSIDDKGVLGEDIISAVNAAGLSAKSFVSVVGTSPNDYYIDLLEDMEPLSVADTIKSVAVQMGNEGGGDTFWVESASDLLAQVATVLQAAERTAIGNTWGIQNGQRLYSLLSILQVSRSDELIMHWIDVVTEAYLSNYPCLADLDNLALRDSIDALINQWIPMIEATKAGISANLRASLKAFSYKESVSEGFATGYSPRKPKLSASQMLGGAWTVINISHLEHGSAGKLVAIFIKSILFKAARLRQLKDPSSDDRRRKWWFDPKPGEVGCKANAITYFIGDEYQSLVTSSKDGLSDATAWNVLRSSGIAGILISQTSAAYRFAIGDTATNNMIRNWKTKIYLPTDDPELIKEEILLVGKTMRFHRQAWDQFESSVANERENHVSVDTLAPASISEEAVFAPFAKLLVPPYADLVELEAGWLPTSSLPGQKNDNEFENRRAVYWRQQDQINSVLQHGILDVDALHPNDMSNMNRGRALVSIPRAGAQVIEIIKLESAK